MHYVTIHIWSLPYIYGHLMSQNTKTALSPDGLTLKQKRFADNYIEHGNGLQAAAAVYNASTPNIAANLACENLQKPKIINYIAGKLQGKDLTPGFVLDKLSEHAHSDEPVVSLKATELIGKHFRMFTDRVDHTVTFDKIQSIGWSDGADVVDVPKE